MRQILTGGLLAMMLLALALAGFTDFLGPPPGPSPAREPAMAGGPPLPVLPPADAPLPDSLAALDREGAQLREGLAQINQTMDRMLDGVLSVLRPYGEARTVDDAASRRLEMLSALRSQSLDRLSRIERRRAEIEAGGDAPPMAAARPTEPLALPTDEAHPSRTAGLPLPGLSASGEDATGGPPASGPRETLTGETLTGETLTGETLTGEASTGDTASLPASPPAAREGRGPAGASGEMTAPDEPAPVLAMPLLPPTPPLVQAPERAAAKPAPRPLRAEPASLRAAAAANPARCRSIILRGQLGEGLSFADRSFLRGHCPG